MSNLVLNRIDPMSYAKVYGALTALIVFVIALLVVILIIPFASMFGGEAASIGIAASVGILIGAPLAYGVFAFLIGLLMAALYNVIAGRIGGIEMEFEEY